MRKSFFNHIRSQFTSVETLPDAKSSAAFYTSSAHVFKDDVDIIPVTLTDGTRYIPWGGNNLLPYELLR